MEGGSIEDGGASYNSKRPSATAHTAEKRAGERGKRVKVEVVDGISGGVYQRL